MIRNENLRDEIRTIMKNDHWTHDALATRMGVPQPYISKILNNKDKVYGRLVEMMDVMGYDIEVRFVRKGRK